VFSGKEIATECSKKRIYLKWQITSSCTGRGFRYASSPPVSFIVRQIETRLKGGLNIMKRYAFSIIGCILLLAFSNSATAAQSTRFEELIKAVKEENLTRVNSILPTVNNVNQKDEDGVTPLHWAIYNISIAQALLKKGADPNAKTNDGLTPLHWAVAKGKKEVVDLLLKSKANPNIPTESGSTPLHWAAERGLVDIAEILIKNGAVVNATDHENLTPLHLAAFGGFQATEELLVSNKAVFPEYALLQATRRNDSTEVKALLSKGVKPERPAGVYRSTPLHWATLDCRQEIVSMMLSDKVDINVKDDAEAIPLHWAVKGGCTNIIETLIAKGGDLKAVSKHPGTEYYYDGAGTTIVQTKHIETLDGTPLHWATHAGRKDIVELLLSKGADVNSKTSYDWTPIYFAAHERHQELVEYLLQQGALANLNDETFGSPLHAARSRHIAEILIKSGCPLNGKCTYYGSPLHMAANEACTEVVTFLLEKGVSVDELATWLIGVTDITTPVTPLYVASLGGRLDVVKLLVSKGANVNYKSPNRLIHNATTGKDEVANYGCGGTVLHAAAWGGHADVCGYLLEKGARIDETGDVPTGRPFTQVWQGVTPLLVAARRGNLEVLTLLLQRGADINAKDKNGYTSLDWAANDEIKEALKKRGAKLGKAEKQD
jgi:ankyrin repeat protein